MVSVENYTEARKQGLKDFRARAARGENPYLPVLDEILKPLSTAGEVNLGLCEIPLNFVIGTRTAARTEAFCWDFMPLLDSGSEFAGKWERLCKAHEEEGIRDPIKVYEFMNRFYVEEGNKRVSVLKYFGATSVSANVTRILPARVDVEEVKRYYEFVDFHAASGIFDIEFSRCGSYDTLLSCIGKKKGEEWTDDDRIDLQASFHFFEKQYLKTFGGKAPVVSGDAFLLSLKVFGYDAIRDAAPSEMAEMVRKVREEILTSALDNTQDLSLDPVEGEKKKSLIAKAVGSILPSTPKKFRCAFVYSRDPGKSLWLGRHEEGRLYLEQNCSDIAETAAFSCIDTDDKAMELFAELAEDKYDAVFVCAAELMDACARAALEYPSLRILNCSLNIGYRSVPSYAIRIYEAKFLSGIIAGCMCMDGRIGYLADYPLYGNIAAINAFALGTKLVNPRAEIYLNWTCLRDTDPIALFRKEKIDYVSGVDTVTDDITGQFGLYLYNGDAHMSIVSPVWRWGVFYEKLIREMISGVFRTVGEDNKALNYWWGMSAGVIDILCADVVPKSTKLLTDMFRSEIVNREFNPLFSEIRDQDGNVHDGGAGFTPEEMIGMDWLADNIVGTIPKHWAMNRGSAELVQAAGVNGGKGTL